MMKCLPADGHTRRVEIDFPFQFSGHNPKLVTRETPLTHLDTMCFKFSQESWLAVRSATHAVDSNANDVYF